MDSSFLPTRKGNKLELVEENIIHLVSINYIFFICMNLILSIMELNLIDSIHIWDLFAKKLKRDLSGSTQYYP